MKKNNTLKLPVLNYPTKTPEENMVEFLEENNKLTKYAIEYYKNYVNKEKFLNKILASNKKEELLKFYIALEIEPQKVLIDNNVSISNPLLETEYSKFKKFFIF